MQTVAKLREFFGRAKSTTDPAEQPNILVISDLHLGEDIKPFTGVGYLRHVARLEKELENFIDHYTRTRHDGRPWRLVINGDMVDFMSICLMPTEEDGGSEEERRFGLGSGPLQTKIKLEKVVQRHPGVFRKLARFVAAGNELVIVSGNHDVEFHWSVVQEAFKDALHRFACEALGIEADEETRAAFVGAISFHPWFYYERGIVYVEHGHQYDETCSFDYILNPEAPKKQDGILLSIGSSAMRYLCNLIPDLNPHGHESWTVLGYMRWAVGLGLRGMARLAYYYCLMLWRILGVWRELREKALDLRRRGEHDERLKQLAARYELDEKLLRDLESLKKPMMMRDIAGIAQTFFLDRAALMISGVIFSLIALFWAPGWWKLVVPAMMVGCWIIDGMLARRRDIDPAKKLARVPAAIARLVAAPFVVFGHSHEPVAQPLDAGAWYFNTGTWVPAERPGLLRSFTHLLIRRGEDGPRAQLCQWRNGGSAAYQG
jgi:UDP-2,3-diacylglucosamine pyrophosphatase LpxH